jgi:hypothetical protein
MMREEPSLEMSWLQNIRTIDKAQIIDRSNTAPSSKTFRDKLFDFNPFIIKGFHVLQSI